MHVGLLANSQHKAMSPVSYLVSLPGQVSGGVPLVPSFPVPKLNSPRKCDVRHLPST